MRSPGITRNLVLTPARVAARLRLHLEKDEIAEAALVDTTTTGVGQVINDKTVQEIPLNGRHFTDLSLLTTGTVTPGGSAG